MRILFLNQYFPPDPAPTGLHLRELAERLSSHGHEVGFVASSQDYRAGKKGRRTIRELKALAAILWRGLRERRPDVVISGTSPPLLLIVATLVAKRHGAKSAHWLFDMYPELALALGEVRAGWFSRRLEAWMGWSYRRTDLLVALDGDMVEHLKKYRVSAEIIAPGVVDPMLANETPAEVAASTPSWLYSGNLGRAHDWETMLAAQRVLEERGSSWRFILQGGGPSWPQAQARAHQLGLQRCEWKTYVDESALRASLLAADVLVATQRPEAQGLLWPSKLALIRTLPRRILWIGPLDGAIARELQELPQAGVFAPGAATEIADWIERGKTCEAVILGAVQTRKAAMEKWVTLLRKLNVD